MVERVVARHSIARIRQTEGRTRNRDTLVQDPVLTLDARRVVQVYVVLECNRTAGATWASRTSRASRTAGIPRAASTISAAGRWRNRRRGRIGIAWGRRARGRAERPVEVPRLTKVRNRYPPERRGIRVQRR